MKQVDYIKDPNITFEKEFDKFPTHKVFYAKLDYNAPQCPSSSCQGKMAKYDFQKP